MQLYQYQIDAIRALWSFWNKKPRGAPLLVCPTGSGKSYIAASIITEISKSYPEFRFLVATHTKEIVAQNSEELQKLLPTERLGIYSAGLGSKTIRRITFANIQSIYKQAKTLKIDMLIIDEAHLVSSKDTSMYQKLISGLQDNNPRLKIMGLTATPMRLDQGSLVGEGSVFSDIAYNISIRQLIDDGFLSPIVSVSKAAPDLNRVRISGFDYNQSDLEYTFNKDQLIKSQCAEIVELGKDRKHWLIFCCGIEHAKNVTEELLSLGITADYVTGEMMPMERDLKIRGFKNEKIRALCNVGVLTTGYNHRAVDLVVLLRSTKSASLYIQCVGRGTRTAEGKNNCLLLDYGSNIDRHGPIDLVSIQRSKTGETKTGTAPHKKCPICGCVTAVRAAKCIVCEYIYPEATKALTINASTTPVLLQPEKIAVTQMSVRKHEKEGKIPSLRIDYIAGIRTFSDFLCLDHEGYACTIGMQKWVKRGGGMPVPKTVDEAILRCKEIPTPSEIRVIKRGKYHEILDTYVLTAQEKEKQQENYEKESIL
ncbi:SSL2 DNA or RNA helicases of superfamily II [uncultured Caudovirales phage]|uniref:SSL2 DNA or RNA helicases of superfamily II n=1 Tax=uncultured Caudovirales phage TaxID=2100421 RepID=A0A6J5S2X6_9CAUD|nr:SSL2 DNA or RNA helicases of superfamily II [uncultured Caudovirales phage]